MPDRWCLTKCCVKMSCSIVVISMCHPISFSRGVAFTKGPYNLLLVAIAFSSTILPNPNPHTEPALLHTCNKLSSSENDYKRAGPRQDRDTFTESYLINIFILCVWGGDLTL